MRTKAIANGRRLTDATPGPARATSHTGRRRVWASMSTGEAARIRSQAPPAIRVKTMT